VLVAAFTVAAPDPLPPPRLEPSFDQTTAVAFASELARQFPDRSPGSTGAARATEWVSTRFADLGLQAERDEFTAELPGLGRVRLVNLIAVAQGRSPERILVLAHRDNTGRSPGANDNASGTAALLELARNVEVSRPAHTLVFISTDGGAFGGVGGARVASHPEILRQRLGGGAVLAVLNLDGIGGRTQPRLLFSGDAARSPAATLVATAEESVRAEMDAPPERPNAFSQLVDLAFPFTLHEQGPFVAEGTPAVTLTTGGERPQPAEDDTLEALDPNQLGELGRSAQALLGSLDEAAELARGTQSYVYVGSRFLRGWTIEFLLFSALIPAILATVDLFARLRRRHIPLAPALRSLVSRFGVWLWVGILLASFSLAGLFPNGESRPVSPDSDAAGDWPVTVLLVFVGLSTLGWLLARPRLAPRRRVGREEDLGGHLAAMLALVLVALVVAAVNPYSLLFVLPSLHAWLWLADVPRENVPLRLGIFLAGLAGPAILAGSFAVRLGLGWDAPWYLLALVSVGYVAPALVAAALAWAAIAGQIGAVALGRYAPYPVREERPPRGPVREGLRRLVLASRARRARRLQEEEPEGEVIPLEEG
jgi:Peptidase family M28